MRLTVAFLCCAALAVSETSSLRREEGYWVQTSTQTIPTAPGARLDIQTYGPVTITNDLPPNQDSALLRVIKRVRARTEAEAASLLRLSVLTTQGDASSVVIHIQRPARLPIPAEVHIRTRGDLTRVGLETYGGDIRVTGVDGNVDVESGGGLIRLDEIGGNVTARTAGGEIRLGRIGGSVRCATGGGTIQAMQTGGESWFETAGGEIHIGETKGPLYASTGGGSIHIGRAGASVSARTAGGRIEVEQANGIVLAGNSSGSIQIGTARGVRCESTGGSIRLRGSGGSLRAVTDIGSILAELLPGLSIQDSVLSTGAGDITVFIPSNFALTIKALSESGRTGRIISEFAEVPVRLSNSPDRSSMTAEGALNGGGPLLTLTSGGGTIYLRRQR
jgi:hypothetical protein